MGVLNEWQMYCIAAIIMGVKEQDCVSRVKEAFRLDRKAMWHRHFDSDNVIQGSKVHLTWGEEKGRLVVEVPDKAVNGIRQTAKGMP